MLDLHIPWRPSLRHETGNPLWRGLATVLRGAIPLSLDPTPGLLAPGVDAKHSVRFVQIPIGDHVTPGIMFLPKAATGATVCLVHGTTAEKTLPYFLWIRALLAAGIQVFTFELDGHGANPRPLTCPGIDDNLPAALKFLRAQPEVDIERIGLLGVSLGGACVLNAAPHEAGIKAVATVSAPHKLKLDDWSKLHEALGMFNPEVLPVCLEATPNRLLDFFTAPMRIAAALDQAHEETDLLNPETLHAINRALRYLNPLDAAASLKNTPVLVVNGEWDNITPPWQAADLYERAAGPKALAMIPRRNHFTVMLSQQAIDTTVMWFRRWV